MVPSTIKIFKIRRLKYELKLVTPIFEIMNDEKEVFEKHWQERSEAYEMLKKDDIQNVLIYTYRKLIELENYISSSGKSKKSLKSLSFFKDYVDLLLSYHNSEFDGYPGTYMHIYSELLVGAQRYLNIKNELKELLCNSEEAGGIT